MSNRNTEFFNQEATIDIQRSTWKDEHNHKTTINNGDLVPFYVNLDVLPGMTIKNQTAVLARMQTPIYPVMDNLFMDTYYFKVPIWTIWDNWKKFMGENEDGQWTQTTEFQTPVFKNPTREVKVNDTNAYMGVPINVKNLEWLQFGVRAYLRVYNYWFRDQNLIAPIKYSTGDEDITTDDTEKTGGKLCKVAKFHDYFTSALPEPQKGSAVSIPLGTTAPVLTNNKAIMWKAGTANQNTISQNTVGSATKLEINGGTAYNGNPVRFGTESGLYADLTDATAATINALRLNFAVQRILEKDARFGTRYNEIIRGQFGVNSPNASLHVPEYLGGNRIPINMETVLQNSSTDAESPLGTTGAMSITLDSNYDFTKSFEEHCVIIGLMCVRAEHTYQQGLARQWSRRNRLDYYYPSFAHLGNMPIYNREIMATGTSQDNEVFGYKEAWAEYKYTPNRISGELLSTYAQTLDSWHYGDMYETLPVLSKEWIEEPYQFVDRTLQIQSSIANQFIVDINIQQTVTAPMPVHCIPGLIDHF